MAKLGDAFSESDRRKSALRRLVPGAVVYLEVIPPEVRESKSLLFASMAPLLACPVEALVWRQFHFASLDPVIV
jgi:hypothetical protein